MKDCENVLAVREEVNGAARAVRRSGQRRSDQLSGGDVPKTELAVVAQGHERPARLVEVDRVDASVVADKRQARGSRRPGALELMAGIELPEYDPARGVADRYQLSGWRKTNCIGGHRSRDCA